MIRQLLLPAILLATCTQTFAADRKPISINAATREKCLSVLRKGTQGEDFWPAMHAAEGLTLGGHGAEVIELLAPKLPHETDDQKRCGLARELVRAGDRSKAGVMLNILAGKDDHGHVHAAESLYKVVEIGDGVAMRRAFAQDESIPLKLMAAAALGRCGNPDAMQFLRKTLNHEDPNALRIAAWILGRIGDKSDIPRLKKQLPRIEDRLLQAYVQHSLAALGNDEGRSALAENLKDEAADVRTYAATFAGDSWATETADTLKAMLDDPHPDAAIRAAQSLLVLAGEPPHDRSEDISVVVYPSTKQNPRYTEGSVIALNDGSLLFAATEFSGSGSDFAAAHIVAMTSTDQGRTWHNKRVLQENTGGMNVMSVTLRRMPSGQIAMYYLQKNSHTDLDAFVRFSDDETKTFGDSILITADEGYHVVNNDRVLQLSTGRLLVPASSCPDVKGGGHFKNHCYMSDDGGLTWRNGKTMLDAPKRGAMEPEVVELNDGRIMMLIRNQLGFVGKSYSTDGGDTWSEMESLGLQGPEAPATLRRIPSTGNLVLIWNNTFEEEADHGGERTPLTAAVSDDDGDTWQTVGNLEDDASRTYSYTSLMFVGERMAMSYWDSKIGDHSWSCRFRSLPVIWLYGNQK
ncbi:exo-alpha-sialidase [Fuerstiella marisgermanici]|uniref:Putative neuraminidase (Sialidase) n=1 Tax=Fuerstiella marisgermanici TaxID=1891926 RepID=A0A1P8WF16_9PLAN|nr:exo-alpha-sialidase [Fuerstiella marisgermanici]APZ92631.1 putative neuraminidase (sialidase) [Fuerstiella marisgermanici]